MNDVQSDDIVEGPILELDPEVAADTAPPVDDIVLPEPKITLQEMWDWLFDETTDRMASDAAFNKIGPPHPTRTRNIRMLTTIANSIAFLIDNEDDFREFKRSQRTKVVPMKRRAR